MHASVTIQPLKEGAPTWLARLSGEVDVFVFPDIKDKLLGAVRAGHDRIIIDLKDVEYIDSSGLGVLVVTHKEARERGGRIAVVCPKPQLRRIFEITGLSKLFGVFYDLDAAQLDMQELALNK